MAEIIKTQGVDYVYNPNTKKEIYALSNVTIDVHQGEFIGVIGRNGSGKSTLAKHINGLLLPTHGSVYVNGMDTSHETNIWDIRQTAGMVFQNPDNQIVATTVEEDVAFGLENLGILQHDMQSRIAEALSIVEMDNYREHAPHLLSGGQKQRVAIAGIIAMRPKILILDEATAMLDPKGRQEVISTVKQLNQTENITIIYVTHFMEEVIDADRLIVMNEGEVITTDTPQLIFREVEKLKNIGLDVPQIVELVHRLRESGKEIPRDTLSVDSLVKLLC